MSIGSENVVGAMIIVFLGLGTYFDVRYKRIPWWIQTMGLMFVLLCVILQWKRLDIGFLLSMLPGVCLLVIAWSTKESIGYGDGISTLLLGGLAGFRNCIWVMCFSLFLLSVIGLVLLVLKKVGRKTRIPYLPFMLAAEGIRRLML